MKTIIVVDLPDNTQIEDFRLDDISVYHRPTQRGYKLQGELKPIPKKKNLKDLKIYRNDGFVKQGYLIGYNECVDDVEGGNE